MKIFSPKRNSLRDFCYINLFVYSNSTEILKGGTYIDKLKFIGLKYVIRQKINLITKALYTEHCFDIDKLKHKLGGNGDNGWDILLNNVVNRLVIKNSTNESGRSNDLLFKDILAFFTLEVQNRHKESDEILSLKNKKMELETSMDLMISEACYKNRKGQFGR